MITSPIAELVGALRFDSARLPHWDETQWLAALPLCDRTQLTLALAERWMDQLPPAVQHRLKRDLINTAERQRRVRTAYTAIANEFEARKLPFVVLKGFAGDGVFFPCAYQRVQYDLDFLVPPDAITSARDALIGLGYHPLQSVDDLPTDHLPAMVPKTGWQWRGDFFDPDIPVCVDLHFRLWDETTERFPAPGCDGFFDRRVTRIWDGLTFPSLAPQDALTYHCLHLLRHLLRGSLRVAHVHELGYLLQSRPPESLDPQTSQLQAIGFALAQRWFGCSIPPAAHEAVDDSPAPIRDWLTRYGDSPLNGLVQPNKDELWLHLSLLNTGKDRRAMLRRRLLPTRIPTYADTAYVPDAEITPRRRWISRARRARFISDRAWHHSRALPRVALQGGRWAWINSNTGRLSAPYWRFLAAATVFNLGSFIFLILYNLYLSDLGYREDRLGQIGSAMTFGSIVGTLPAGMMLRRWGARATLTICFAALAIFSAGRVLFPVPTLLLVFAFLSGAAFSLFAITVAPAIARLTNEETRPRAFSIFFSLGIGLGIIGGQLAGRLPALLGSKRAALLVACAMIGLAVFPALSLRMEPIAAASRRIYPSGPFVGRFLTAVAIWSMAAGAFSPFFNVFFATRLNAAVEQIGNIYSLGQVAQVTAILVAPYLLARAGLNRGVAISQLCCGVALLALAFASQAGIGTAAICYAAYLGFHFMGEPGLFSLLMNHAAPEQQSGASALNFLATFAGQAVAVAVAGFVVTRGGYAPVLIGASILSMIAAILVWRLMSDQTTQ